MTPLVHSSFGTITLVPGVSLNPRKEIYLTRADSSSKCRKLKSPERVFLPQSSSTLFHPYRNRYSSIIRTIAAVGTEVTVEESSAAATGEITDDNVEKQSITEPSNPSPVSSTKSKRPRSVRKSEMPLVRDEELVPGASFTGKVRSVQPFGCFVDFGAYTDGLVHVSRMSDGYVKDVASFVSIGQEVKVRIVEADRETGRISLTMRENDDSSKVQQKRETPKGENNEKPRSARKSTPRTNQKREDTQKSTNLVKGQILDGTVKNLTRSGAFVSLPDGEEGFLPASEESEGFGGILGSSSLQVGQEVNVRVLRIARGRVTLTMKKEEDVEGLNMQLTKGVTHVATNPFELAFRRNKEIAAFLDERGRIHSEKPEESVGKVDELSAESDCLEADGSTISDDEQLEDSEEKYSSTLSADLLIEGEESSETSTSSSSNSVLDEVSETTAIGGNGTINDQNLNLEGDELTENDSSVTEVLDEASLTNDSEEVSTVIDEVKEIDENKTLEDQKLSSEGGGLTENDSSVTEVVDEASLTDKAEASSAVNEAVEESPIVDEKVAASANLEDEKVEAAGSINAQSGASDLGSDGQG